MAYGVESFANDDTDDIQFSPLDHQSSNSIKEGSQDCQKLFILGKLMLAAPNHLLSMPRNVLQEDLFCNTPRCHNKVEPM